MTTSKTTHNINEKIQREIKQEEAEIERVIATSFTASYMSNRKWERLLNAAAKHTIKECAWKFVADDRIWKTKIPKSEDLKQGCFENTNGFFKLKHAEWIELLTDKPQDLLEILKPVGKFEIEETESGLRVYGYK